MPEAKYRVYDSAVLEAPIEELWPVFRDILRVLPMIFGDALKDPYWVEGSSPEKVPSRFNFSLHPSGDSFQEEIVGRSESEHSLTYRLLNQAVGVTGYVATYRLRSITSEPGKTFFEYSREFAVAPGEDPAKVAPFVAQLCAQQVLALKKRFSKRS